MAYGMTAAGFVRKTLDVCKSEIEDSYKGAFGNGIRLVDSIFSFFVGVHAEREAEVWELAEAIYNSQYPDTAEGAALRNVVALTGHEELVATKSLVTAATISGDAGTVIPAGKVASVNGSGARFVTLTEVTIGGGGTVTVDLEAEETGPVEAPAGTLTQIETPVSGWDAITNATAAALGRNTETDAELRARREEDLANAKAGQTEAVRQAILAVFGVTDCSITQNQADVDDAAGRPPHSFEAVVVGGDDDAIREAIWGAKPAGVATYGTVTGYVEDDEGNSQEVQFSRGVGVTVYLAVAVTRNTAYPVDGDTRIKDLLVAYGETLGAGDDVANFPLVDALSEDATLRKGIDAVVIYQGKTAGPTTTTTIALAPNEIASILAANITVT